MAASLVSLVPHTRSFPRRRVLVVGDLVADHYIYGQTERVSREAPVLIVRWESSEVKLGGGANAAANVRSLGGQCTAVGAIGRDAMGRELRGLFKAAGIRLQAVGGAETETKTRILAGGVNTTRQQMLRLDKGARCSLPPRVQKGLARAVREAARDVDAVLVSDYGAGVIFGGVLEELSRLAKDGLPVCVDSRYGLGRFKDFTLLKPNEPELAALTGIAIGSEGDLMRAGLQAQRILGCKTLVVTRGRSGMAIFGGGQVELVPVHGAADAVDVTGAGDTVIAALTLALAAGAPVADAARIANVAGALVVQKQGTATITRDELVEALGGKAS
jgi:D-glycero-beta-D-manno-heptose-7-phosphate kinase